MENSKPKPIELNFKNIREERQKNNDKNVYEILQEGNREKLYDNINKKELERIQELLECTEEAIISKCKDNNNIALLVSYIISKKASRQGNKDEEEQLKTCNHTSEKCGVSIKKLNGTDFRPTKDGSIVSNDEMKKNKIPKDCCLKSFDAKISGKVNGFISAKVSYGKGGHQDNVIEELDTLAEWWKKYKYKSKEILIILIDTDLTTEKKTLEEKFSNIDNINVFNHIEFQNYIIDKYYEK